MKYHLCLDIRGALNNGRTDGFRHDDGRPMTKQEGRDALYDELAKGRRMIPLGECDNFDYQKGCLGHEEPPA
jgi:hypothetical protein